MYKKTYPLVGLLVIIVIAIAAGLLELFHPELMILGVIVGMIVLGVQVYISRKETADIARALEKHIKDNNDDQIDTAYSIRQTDELVKKNEFVASQAINDLDQRVYELEKQKRPAKKKK